MLNEKREVLIEHKIEQECKKMKKFPLNCPKFKFKISINC